MAFKAERVNEIDQSTVEGMDALYPLIQWSYGNVKDAAKHKGGDFLVDTHGGLFVSDERFPAAIADELRVAMLSNGWQEDSIFTGKGEEITGLSRRSIEVAEVNVRKCWTADDGAVVAPFTWKDWQALVDEHGRAKSKLNLFVLVKGLEDFGPFVVTLSGSAGMAFEGTKKQAGVCTAFDSTVIAAANAASEGGRWPRRAFWLEFGAAQDAKGKAVFTTVGKDETADLVLPMAYGLPADADGVDLDAYALDDDAWEEVELLYADSVEWAAEWDAFEEADAEENGEEQEKEATEDKLDEVLEAAGM